MTQPYFFTRTFRHTADTWNAKASAFSSHTSYPSINPITEGLPTCRPKTQK
jgi:hypothetical protein